jgi:hypothetical protein
MAHSDPSMSVRRHERATARDLEARYGRALADTALVAPIATWVGPVESPRGAHIIRIAARREPILPSLDSVAHRVRAEMIRDIKRDNFQRRYKRTARLCEVEIAHGAEAGSRPFVGVQVVAPTASFAD